MAKSEEDNLELEDAGSPDEVVNLSPKCRRDALGLMPSVSSRVSFIRMNFMLCFNLCNGVLLASYMLLVLPLESQRIDNENRSVVLGSLMFIAGISQLINPLVGLLSDRCMSSWGRRRPFIVVGGVLGACGMLLQDFASMSRSPALYYLAYALSMLALNTAYTAVVGIMPDLIPQEQAGTASGIAALHTVGGANLGFLVYDNVGGSNDDRLHAMYMSFVSITTVCITLTVFACDEVPLVDSHGAQTVPTELSEDDNPEAESQRTPARGISRPVPGERCLSVPVRHRDVVDSYYIDPRKHSDFTFVFWSRTFYYFGASIQTFFKFYLKDVVGVEDAEATIVKTAIIGQLFAAATAIPTGLLSDSLGKIRKPFIYAACVVLAIGQVFNCFVRDETEVFIVCGVLGCANGVYLSMDAALALDTLPSGDEAARFMGVWGIGCFLGGAIGPVLGGPILMWCGHNAILPDAYNYSGYAILFALAAVCFLASGVILHFVGPPGEGQMPWCVCLRRYIRKLRGSSNKDVTGAAKASSRPAHNSLKWFKRGSAGLWLNC